MFFKQLVGEIFDSDFDLWVYNYRNARAAVQYSRSRCQVHVTTAEKRGVLTSAPAVPQLMSEFIMQIARLRDCESSFLC